MLAEFFYSILTLASPNKNGAPETPKAPNAPRERSNSDGPSPCRLNFSSGDRIAEALAKDSQDDKLKELLSALYTISKDFKTKILTGKPCDDQDKIRALIQEILAEDIGYDVFRYTDLRKQNLINSGPLVKKILAKLKWVGEQCDYQPIVTTVTAVIQAFCEKTALDSRFFSDFSIDNIYPMVVNHLTLLIKILEQYLNLYEFNVNDGSEPEIEEDTSIDESVDSRITHEDTSIDGSVDSRITHIITHWQQDQIDFINEGMLSQSEMGKRLLLHLLVRALQTETKDDPDDYLPNNLASSSEQDYKLRLKTYTHYKLLYEVREENECALAFIKSTANLGLPVLNDFFENPKKQVAKLYRHLTEAHLVESFKVSLYQSLLTHDQETFSSAQLMEATIDRYKEELAEVKNNDNKALSNQKIIFLAEKFRTKLESETANIPANLAEIEYNDLLKRSELKIQHAHKELMCLTSELAPTDEKTAHLGGRLYDIIDSDGKTLGHLSYELANAHNELLLECARKIHPSTQNLYVNQVKEDWSITLKMDDDDKTLNPIDRANLVSEPGLQLVKEADGSHTLVLHNNDNNKEVRLFDKYGADNKTSLTCFIKQETQDKLISFDGATGQDQTASANKSRFLKQCDPADFLGSPSALAMLISAEIAQDALFDCLEITLQALLVCIQNSTMASFGNNQQIDEQILQTLEKPHILEKIISAVRLSILSNDYLNIAKEVYETLVKEISGSAEGHGIRIIGERTFIEEFDRIRRLAIPKEVSSPSSLQIRDDNEFSAALKTAIKQKSNSKISELVNQAQNKHNYQNIIKEQTIQKHSDLIQQRTQIAPKLKRFDDILSHFNNLFIYLKAECDKCRDVDKNSESILFERMKLLQQLLGELKKEPNSTTWRTIINDSQIYQRFNTHRSKCIFLRWGCTTSLKKLSRAIDNAVILPGPMPVR